MALYVAWIWGGLHCIAGCSAYTASTPADTMANARTSIFRWGFRIDPPYLVDLVAFNTVIATQRSPHWPNIFGALWIALLGVVTGGITTNSTQSLQPVCVGEDICALNRHAPGADRKVGGAPAPKPV